MQAQIKIGENDVLIAGNTEDQYYAHYVKHPIYIDDITGVLKSVIRSDFICFDVGANIGLTTVYMATLAPSGRIYAFEPSSSTFAFLLKNISSFPHVSAERLALGAVDGALPMVKVPGFSAGNYLMHNGASPTEHQDVELVPLQCLDNYVDRNRINRIDLVKIDVEGFEPDVIKGATATLARFNPVVIMELNANRVQNSGRNPKHYVMDMFKMFELVCIIDRNSQDVLRLELDDRLLSVMLEVNAIEGSVDNLLCLTRFREIPGINIRHYYHGLVEKFRRTFEHRDQALRDRDHAIWLYRKALGEISD